MENDPSDQLYPVMSHSKTSFCRLPHNRICLRQNIIQRLAVRKTLFELSCLIFQLLIGQYLYLRFQCIDPVYDRVDTLQFIFTVRTENFLYKPHSLN